MTPLGIATNGLLARGAQPTEHIAVQGFLCEQSLDDGVSGGSGKGWKNYKALTATPDPVKGGGYYYSPQYLAKAKELDKAETEEIELANQVAATTKQLVYLASERAGARHQRNALRNRLEAEKKALEAAMAYVEELAAQLKRMQREEDEAIALLLLLD